MSDYTPSNTNNRVDEAPELPPKAHLPTHLGLDACPWLDNYIEFSKMWSPRSYDGYHEGVGLWILSTIAARRVSINFGKERYTNLYILLVGRTTIDAKSSVAQIGKDLIHHLGLDFLLLPDDSTPQSLLVEMSSKIPDNYDMLNAEQKENVRLSLSFAGQRGLYLDEFGQQVNAMMRKDGPYTDYRTILRKFDDTEPVYQRSTIQRGNETVNRPYLALLGALTPADLIPIIKKGSQLWGDGYLARMAMILPPEGFHKNGRFPKGQRIYPNELLTPLRDWHARLGIPEIRINNGILIHPSYLPSSKLELSDETYEAYYNYDEALREILLNQNLPDLDGNYGRLPEKALRVAGLFASLDNCPVIELKHWARAQEITERWRRNLHELYRQVNSGCTQTKKLTAKEKVKRAIIEKVFPTKREIQQFTGLSTEDVEGALIQLISDGEVVQEQVGRTIRHKLQRFENQE